MTKRKSELTPKIWRDNPGRHFNPHWQRQADDKRMHERGQENKVRWAMGERNKNRPKIEHELHGVAIRKAPITLATLKWGSHE